MTPTDGSEAGSGKSVEHRLMALEFRVSILWRFLQAAMGGLLMAVGAAILKLVLVS